MCQGVVSPVLPLDFQGGISDVPAMPKVGKRHFSYSKAGKAAAKKYAKKTGKKMRKKCK
jgi:hypothetical protein